MQKHRQGAVELAWQHRLQKTGFAFSEEYLRKALRKSLESRGHAH